MTMDEYRDRIAGQFAAGIDGEGPAQPVVEMVDRVATAIEAKTTGRVYSVDDDGAFSFDAWTSNGLYMMCEIDIYGEINAGTYHGPAGPQERFMRQITERELLDNL